MKASPNAALPTPPIHQPKPTPTRAGIDQLADQIAELSAHIQAATYRFLMLIGEFDRREGWGAQGASTCAHWLAWRIGLDLGAAREKVRVARALPELPKIGDAMRRGEISYSKVRALTRVATPENEEELLGFARAGTASHVESLIRAWRRVDRLEEAETDERRRQHRYVRTYTDEDGMLVVRARLEPEAGAALLKALDSAQDRIYRSARVRRDEGPAKRQESSRSPEASERQATNEPSRPNEQQPCDSERPAAVPKLPLALTAAPEPEASYGQRRADALALVAEAALGQGLDGSEASTGGDQHQVVVHVDAAALVKGSETGQSALEGGAHVSAETSRRLSCDASKVVMTHGRDGRILDVGRKTRTVPPAIRRALTFRDRGCRFPGCGVKICDAHHVEHWADGGATRLGNLVLLCRRHHRAIHEEGYRVLLRRDGSSEFYSPLGRRIQPVPVSPSVPERPVRALRLANQQRGIGIDADTAMPSWDGRPLDLHWAVQVLWSSGRERASAS